jgi:serine/threonine protein kinase
MELNEGTQTLLNEIGLAYIETIADRRDTLVLRVSRGGKKMILKLHSEGGSKESESKAKLLMREANILEAIPQLTNNLFVDRGTSNGRQWLLIREIDGREIYQAAKHARESIVGQKDQIAFLMGLVKKVSGFYDTLYAGGYLHGDVQPAHTYLERDWITVIDWGLARKINEPNPLYKGGLVYYVAPEIARQMAAGDAGIDYGSRSEVYAIGSTLFMIYTGSLAVDFGMPKADLRNAPMDQKLQRAIGNHIFSFKETGAHPHSDLEAILRKSLSTNPEDRFADPSLLHERLMALEVS